MYYNTFYLQINYTITDPVYEYKLQTIICIFRNAMGKLMLNEAGQSYNFKQVRSKS